MAEEKIELTGHFADVFTKHREDVGDDEAKERFRRFLWFYQALSFPAKPKSEALAYAAAMFTTRMTQGEDTFYGMRMDTAVAALGELSVLISESAEKEPAKKAKKEKA